MKKIVGLSLVLSTALAFSGVAMAADTAATSTGTRVAVVEIAKVLHDSPQVKKNVDQLKAQFSKDQKAIEAKQAALETAMKDFKKNDAVMSAADKAKTEKTIAEQRQSLVQEIGTFQQKLTAEQKKIMDSVFKELNQVVQKIAKEQHFDVVLDSQFVLYGVPAVDITAQVEKAFDAQGAAVKSKK